MCLDANANRACGAYFQAGQRRTRSICWSRSSARGDAVDGKYELKGPGGRCAAHAKMLFSAACEVMKSSFSGGGTPIFRTMSSSWC